MTAISVLRAYLQKDVAREMRTKETFLSVAAFGFLIVLILAFALPAMASDDAVRAAGAFWVAMLFASQVGIARAIDAERSGGRLETVLATPADPALVFVAKSVALFLFLALSAGVLAFPLMVFYHLEPSQIMRAAPGILLGIAGLSLAGSLLALLAAGTRLKEILGPILFLTIFVPLLLAAVSSTREALQGNAAGLGVQILAGFDLLIGGASIILAPYVMEE